MALKLTPPVTVRNSVRPLPGTRSEFETQRRISLSLGAEADSHVELHKVLIKWYSDASKMVKLVITTFIRMKGTSSRFSQLQTAFTPRLSRKTPSHRHSGQPLFTTTRHPCSSTSPQSQSWDPSRPPWSSITPWPMRRPPLLTNSLTGLTWRVSPGLAPSPLHCPASSTPWCSPPWRPAPRCGSVTTSRPPWCISGGGGRPCIMSSVLTSLTDDQTGGTQLVQQETNISLY